MEQVTVHASTVAFQQGGVAHAAVLSGRSGCGKSALALELMAMGGILVSDDQTRLYAKGGALVASAPPSLAGLIEWRGVGVLTAQAVAQAHVVVWLDMDIPAPARMPEPAWTTCLGIRVPLLHMPARQGVAAGLKQYVIGGTWRCHGKGTT